jgi:hypothetical protein
MREDYEMFRDSGYGPIGAVFITLYVTIIGGPTMMALDYLGRNHVGETGFEFDDDFDGDVEFIEESPFDDDKF